MENYWSEFLTVNSLPQQYIETANSVFAHLVNEIVTQQKKMTGKPLFIGINGCQGSGKSTLASYLVTVLENLHQLRVISISLDDFYYSQKQRKHLAANIHPLLSTRGVPGTHDVNKLKQVLNDLTRQKNCVIPIFDKATDNPLPESLTLPDKNHPDTIDVVIIEGWCWGVDAQQPDELIEPVNLLETEQDINAVWRTYVNDQLKHNYQFLYRKMDLWLMLKAPSFDCVYQWRLEQENKLRQQQTQKDLIFNKETPNSLMNDEQIFHFIQYFQRLTEHAFKTLPNKVDFLLELDENRQVVSCKSQKPTRLGNI